MPDNIRKIPFSPPDISEQEISEVVDTLYSGWITTGPKTKELERRIADWVGVERCVCLNSQTACAELALHLLGIGDGDEVITCAYTYTATASVISQVGAKIVLVDTQKSSLEMDYEALEKAINEKTKAIIPVDLAGIPCDYDRIFEIVNRKKCIFKPSKNDIQQALGRVAVLADTAHAFGAKFNGKMVGSIADFSSFSFHAVKNLTTGEGGALTWNTIPGVSNEEIYKRLQVFSLHGQTKDALAKTQLGAWEYDIIGLHYKRNLTDIAAAMGLKQFERYPEMLRRRREIIAKYDSAFRPLGIKTLEHYTKEKESSGHLYLTRIPDIDSEQRNEIISKMAEKGIACNVHYKPLPMFTAYKNIGFNIDDYPNAYEHYENEITLPLHTKLSDADVDYIIENYINIVGGYINPGFTTTEVQKEKPLARFENKIWLASPTMHGDELKYISEAYHTNWMSTIGENINQIEKNACEIIGCKYAVALASCTSALHLAVKLTDLKPGDKIFCSDMTFAASVNPVLYEKAEPIFIDTEYDTWNMDPIALEKAFESYPDVRVVILAHLYGTPAKLDEILAVCKKYNAILIEDAAESFGATYKGEQTGMFGRYNCISFNGNKIITGSSGGMFLTDDEEAAMKVKKWSTQSRENAPWYQHEEVGYNYRMSNVIAGVVRGQIPYLEEHIAKKKAIYERYKEGFKDLPVSMNPYDITKSCPNFWLSCMIINPDSVCQQTIGETSSTYVSETGKSCPAEILERLAEYNVEARPIWKPMHMQPIYRDCDFFTVNGKEDADYSVGRDIFCRGLCLPSDIKMTADEQNKIIEIIRSCFN